jgi:hypothetical protein
MVVIVERARWPAGTEWVVAWVALTTWATTAALGLNLAVRGGAIRLLMRAPIAWRRRRRRGWNHRKLFMGHILLATIGLALWAWYTVKDVEAAGWLAAGALGIAALHGLSLIERWIPGRGRHATGRSVDYTRHGYFPVLAATGHVMLATVTVVLVIVTLVGA